VTQRGTLIYQQSDDSGVPLAHGTVQRRVTVVVAYRVGIRPACVRGCVSREKVPHVRQQVVRRAPLKSSA
jgi:hypothetical protein